MAAPGTRMPPASSTRVYGLPSLERGRADELAARLKVLPGVREVTVSIRTREAHVTVVDSAAFDEENVLKIIAQTGVQGWPQSTK